MKQHLKIVLFINLIVASKFCFANWKVLNAETTVKDVINKNINEMC